MKETNKLPQNKNFQKRITILDECFASQTGAYTIDKLIDLVKNRLGLKVSRRTIQNDISYIKETIENNNAVKIDFSLNPVFIPRLFDGKKTVFKYSDNKLALGNQLLSKTDKEQLNETLSILSRYRNREDFYWLDELFPRIEASFELVHEDFNSLISYQSNRDYSGQSWVGVIYNQLLRKKVLIIEYRNFNADTSYLRKIHPYHLKQYNNRWFLMGYEESKKYTGITNLALDRIIDITETVQDIRKDTMNWGDYFDEIIGVSRPVGEEPTEIKLRFTRKQIPYVLTKPIHGASQKLDKEDPEQRTISIEVIPNFELYQTILSFGAEVQVISPQSVINKMEELIKQMKNGYS